MKTSRPDFMETWMVLASICLVGCSSPKPPVVKLRPLPGSAIGLEAAGSVRYPESLKAYYIGRYVEPQNRSVMHEHHAVYRVETTATWNLHPGPSDPVRPISAKALRNSAYSPAPSNDGIIAEFNRQKQITQAVMAEAAKLTASLDQLGQAISATRAIAEENVKLHRQMSGVLTRLKSLETEFKKQQEAQSPAANLSDSTPAEK